MVGSGIKPRKFVATELIRAGSIWLFRNGSRQVLPPTTRVVSGSKICPANTGRPVQGLVSPVGAPRNALKSPLRIASLGSRLRLLPPCCCKYCSHEKKKKVLLRPL